MSEISLKEYTDTRLDGIEKQIVSLRDLVEQRFNMKECSDAKSAEAMAARLEHMNQFRTQINEERAGYVGRELMDKEIKLLDNRIKSLETTQAFSAGKLWVVMAIFAGIPTILALIALFRG